MKATAPASGFSLLELMVVLAVMGIVVSLGVPLLDPSRRQPLETTREVLRQELREARQLAVQGQRLIGWRPDETGYRFLTWREDGRWEPLADGRLTAGAWPDGVTVTRRDPSDAPTAMPWVIWWPDGEVAGTTLMLHHAQRHLELAVGRPP
ncbi:prepilin-type N-terminal cleavage/methylation domain-containing protein [Halomonas sp. SSL-5]|uniref:prepilin-type N-terminal cleavage/methylation domain-containing protein n=1 Tax=Halomonas sp. SSL-5 TaxID=3065855 RepID=UPI002739A705|nr:prepilin-type N-terminal cleavage/methylation domain-containing protein [Halomonas sp. SSL-5]MDY7117020.1 prepilin-type N-terminal cleavage/methylation domain-containing protein [Halomonas sp. SSL-5]